MLQTRPAHEQSQRRVAIGSREVANIATFCHRMRSHGPDLRSRATVIKARTINAAAKAPFEPEIKISTNSKGFTEANSGKTGNNVMKISLSLCENSVTFGPVSPARGKRWQILSFVRHRSLRIN
ncbi:hypothetical protein ACN2XU_17825 [Primorskyibacter sp. 2E107]